MDFSVREQKKRCSSWTHEAFLKEHSTVVKEHNRSVSSSWLPVLPSRGQMFVKATSTNPAALLLCVVYLYTVVQPWIKAQTLSIFIDLLRPICTLYILYLKPVGNVYFSIGTDWNEWMFMYSNTYCCASLLYPSMVGTRRRRLKLNTVWGPQQNHCFQKSINKVILHYSNNTVVHWRKDILWNSL